MTTSLFKYIFLKEKCCILIQILLKIIPWVLLNNVSIGSGNGLALYRQQAITWTNVD